MYTQLAHLKQNRKNQVFNYAVSVPWRKVRANGGEEAIVAWEMNGEPLPKIHGYPLRVVISGVIGARSTKWVYKINALEDPSMGPVQRQEYLYFSQQVCIHPDTHVELRVRVYERMLRWFVVPQFGKQNVKYSNGFSIQNMPVSCVFT